MNTVDIMRDLERRRKSIQLKKIIAVCLFIFLFLGFFIYATNPSGPLFMFGSMIAMAILFWKANKETKEFKIIYKDTFVIGALREVFGNVTYDPLRGFSEYDVARTGVIQMGNRFSSEDFVEGSYDGVHFRQSDVVVKRETGSGKNKHTYIHFNGRLFEFDCPLPENVSTLMFSKNYQYPGRGLGIRYEKVNMENATFNKRFKIKSAREIDAFYILTPHMMECVDNILMKAKSVGLHFANNKLYLGINYGGMGAFDAKMNRPLVYANEIAKIKADTAVIVDIIRTLKLDENAREDQIRKYGGVMDPIAGLQNQMQMGQQFMNQAPTGQQMYNQQPQRQPFYNQPPEESKYGFTLKK